ncbi:hypothetical protein PHYPSEUDO_013911 [Phytophthora pseudosyringae]|uniref:SGNH hydrolase-type esterase domain-containing protein n=1 Tax=Phytophthora pseudosyringae TaxID=221518 RepID=A0A8T1W2W2_9STRA|nr:hypothetical protein PHYPSEUDO_013911 [Phytophthora pseudosyringae]
MTKKYAQACVETAASIGVPVLDMNSYFNAMPESTRDAFLVDGLHFNAEGNKVVDEQVRSRIAAEFPALDAVLRDWQFPPASKWALEDPTSENEAKS